MRIALTFIAAVALIITISALFEADWQTIALAGPVAAIAGTMLLRNLRDPEVGRKHGFHATIAFSATRAAGLDAAGTFAEVKTHNQSWSVVIDRAPEQGDQALWGRNQRGWVWLDAEGLPQKLRIDYGTTWNSWPVLTAAAAS